MTHNSHASHPAHFHRPDTISDPLYVIATVFNPQRFRSRWVLYKQFEAHVLSTPNVVLYTIECTFGDRSKVFTEPVAENHVIIHVQTKHEIWLKENMINIAMRHLPSGWKYSAWVDADISFVHPEWAKETIQQLQHYDVVQMFSHAHDLDANYQPYQINESFMYSYVRMTAEGGELLPDGYGLKKIGTHLWHPGFAWAARKDAIDQLGGLVDFGICGAGDHHMACALIGEVDRSFPKTIHKEYSDALHDWQDRALKHIRKNVGYVSGIILHHFHGSKNHRKYADRWEILTSNNFQPSKDIKYDTQGLLQLTDRSIGLRDGLRNYFRQRNEDCIFLGQEERRF